jgi:uncharacterized protein
MRPLIGMVIALALTPFAGEAAMAEPHSATETRNLALVQSGFEAWRNGSGSPFDLLAEDASWTIVGRSDAAKTYPTRAAFMDEVIRPFNARMQRALTPTVRRIYADGDTVVVLFDAEAPAKDGVRYVNTYAWFLEMKAGKVVRADAFFDSITFNELWRRVRP